MMSSSLSSSFVVEQQQHQPKTTTAAAAANHNNNNNNNNVAVVTTNNETNNSNNSIEVHHDHQNLHHQNPEQPQQDDAGRDDDATSASNSSSSSLKKAKTTIKEMIYCFESYALVFTPVSLCMICSALAVVFINTEETREATQQQFAKTYEVSNISDDNSNSKNTLSSIGNAMIIVSVVCFMTFVVALLYKYRCMKIFYGYMILVTTILLGFLSSNMWIIIIEKYNWYRIDKFSFAFVIWNFTIVGILAIFWPIGIPKFVQQGYLIASSVILAWQLSFFSNWTAWTLLVVLALYDLFAVLSPYGPLKYLAKLMSKQNAPSIPGLLYEAQLPRGVSKPKRRSDDNDNDDNNNDETNQQEQQQDDADNNNPSSSSVPSSAPSSMQQQQQSKTESKPVDVDERSSTLKTLPAGSSQFMTTNNNGQSSSSSRVLMRSSNNSGENVEVSQQQQQDHHPPPPFFVSSNNGSNNSTGNKAEEDSSVAVTPNELLLVEEQTSPPSLNTGRIPLAIAKLYKLRVVDEEGALKPKQKLLSWGRKKSYNNDITWQTHYTPDEINEIEWASKQLRTVVTGIFPQNGGKIEKSTDEDDLDKENDEDGGPRYNVYNRNGDLLRKFVVNKDGQVMQVIKKERSGDDDDDDSNNSIKLGLVSFVLI